MKKIILLLILICCGAWAGAQPIQLQIEIFPPYPVSLEYYLNNADNAFVSITNTTGADRELYFHTRISANTGLLAQTKPGYRPSIPFTVPAFGTLVLTGNDLENTDFGFNSLSDVDISGVTPEQRDLILFNRALPEGTYEVCILAFDWATGAPVGFNCSAHFDILYGDMPVIILPMQDDVVEANDNSFFFTFWEPPFTYAPLPSTFEYRLKMIDITGQPFNDLEILMNDPGQFPLLDEAGIIDQVFNYQYPDQIELIEGHQYALRVQAIDPTGQTPVTNNGYSEITTFWYGFRPGDGDGTGIPAPEAAASNCESDCEFGEIANQAPVTSIASFSSLQIGYFTIELQSVSNESGNRAAGTGTIVIPFLDSVRVNVEFEDVKVNANGRIYEGQVYAVKDYDYDPNDPVSVSGLDRFLRTERLISIMLGGRGRALNMPAGIVWDINGEHLMLGFNNMAFTPERASCQVMYNLHYPSWGNYWLSLSASDICLLPAGFGEEFILHPVVDIDLPDIGDTKYILKGSAAATAESVKASATYVEIDCKGIKDFGLNIEVQFSREVLVPDTEDGAPGEGRVSGAITLSYPRAADSPALGSGTPPDFGFLGQFSMAPFQIRGLPGLGFTLNQGWVDFSDTRNPPDMRVPANYQDDNVTTQNGVRSLDPLWEGFYMKSLTARSAEGWLFEQERFQFEVADMIMDNLLTAKIRASSIADGDIGNWYLSLDTLYIELVQWSANNTGTWNAGLNGRLGMPITAADQYLQYSAFISPQDEGRAPNMEFLVQPPVGLTFPFMQSASANLCPNSYVRVVQSDGTAFFDAQLAGNMEVAFTEPVTFTIPWVDFQFGYHSRDGFSNQAFSILGQAVTGDGASCDNLPPPPTSGAGSSTGSGGASGAPTSGSGPLPPPPGATSKPMAVNNFPINIEELRIVQQNINSVRFNINPRVELGGGGQSGFGADVDLAVKSQMNTSSKKLAFDGIDLGSLEIVMDDIFGMSINGNIEFYQENSDRGARGELSVSLPLGISTELKADFGVRAINFNRPFGETANYFGYWYVDGMVGFPGVPIAPGVNLHGLGGGVYMNMRRNDGFSNDNASAVQAVVNDVLGQIPAVDVSVASTPDALRPSPEFGTYGLKLATRLAAPVSSALNMDVSIAGSFAQGVGINSLRIDGDAYLMSSIENRSKESNFWASAGFGWERVGKHHVFDGNISLFANVANGLITGPNGQPKVIDARFHVHSGTEQWYFHAGDPRADMAGLQLKLGPITAQATGYFMVGHNLPSELPMPARIAHILNSPKQGDSDNGLDNTAPVSKTARARDGNDVAMAQQAQGIAFGAQLATDTDVKAWFIYASLSTTVGMDVNLTYSPDRTCSGAGSRSDKPGVNGWYATGQVYAGLEGEIGLRGKLLGKEREFSLFEMAAAMLLSAGGPNPTWVEGRAGIYYRVLNGLIKGRKTIDITVGEKCVPPYEGLFDEIPILYEMWPEDGARDVSVFEDPLATFILPVNEQFPIPMINQQTKLPYTAVLEIEIESLYVKNQSTGTNLPVTQSWSQDKKALTFDIRKMDERTEHEVYIKLIAWDYTDSSNPKRLKNEAGSDWAEAHTRTFRTGRDPYPIPHEMVSKTLPIRNQRFFLQDEVFKLFGKSTLIAFAEDMASTDPSKGYFRANDDNVEYEYFFRWQDLEGGEPITDNLNNLHGASTVSVILGALPQLQNDAYYSCQLVRRAIKYVNLPSGERMPAPNIGDNSGTLLSELRTTNLSVAGFENDLTGSHEVNIEIQLDPGKQLGRNEDLIYQWYFKTSRYNTLDDKMANTSITQVNNTSALSHYPTLYLHNDEGFDVFDMVGEFGAAGAPITVPRVEVEVELVRDLKYSAAFGLTGVGVHGQGSAGTNPLSGNNSVIRQPDYVHTANQGLSGYNNYLNHSAIGLVNLFEEMQSKTHSWTYTNPQTTCNTQTTLNVSFTWNALLSDLTPATYLQSVIPMNFNSRATNYKSALTDGEIGEVWGAYLDEVPYQPYAASSSSTSGLSVSNVYIPTQISYDLPIRVAIDIMNISAWATDQILDATWGMSFANCVPPPANPVVPGVVNKYNDLINERYPAFTKQLDLLFTNYYQMQQHQGSYSLKFQADKGFLNNTRIPGSNRVLNFTY